MKKILFFLILILFFKPVFADTLKGGFPVCVTKETYKQFMKAYMENREYECQYLSKKKFCSFLPAGIQVTVMDQLGWDAEAKVRVFVGDEVLIMWTHLKNIEREK